MYTDAFLVDIDPPAVAKNAIDEPTRQQLMAAWLSSLPATPARLLSHYPAVMAALNPTSPGKSKATTAPSSASPTPVTREQLAIIQDAIRDRDDWHNERRNRLKISDYAKFDQACQALVQERLLVIHSVRLSKITYCLLEVTEAGFAIANLPRPMGYIGHGGFVHTVLISRIATHLKKTGWKNVRTEFPVGRQRHAVDVYGVDRTGVTTAFEVTLSTSNVVTNALKTLTLPTAVQQLVFLGPIDKDCKNVERILSKDPAVKPYLAQIRIERIDGYI